MEKTLVDEIFKNYPNLNEDLSNLPICAAKYGNVIHLQFSKEKGLFSTGKEYLILIKKIWIILGENGYLNCIKYLHHNEKIIIPNSLYISCALNGHVEVLKWAFENKLIKSNLGLMNLLFEKASLGGHKKILKLLINTYKIDKTYAIELEWYRKSFLAASMNGHINILKFLIKYEKPDGVYTEAWFASIKSNQLEVLKWFFANHKLITGGKYPYSFYYSYLNSMEYIIKYNNNSDMIDWLGKTL